MSIMDQAIFTTQPGSLSQNLWRDSFHYARSVLSTNTHSLTYVSVLDQFSEYTRASSLREPVEATDGIVDQLRCHDKRWFG